MSSTSLTFEVRFSQMPRAEIDALPELKLRRCRKICQDRVADFRGPVPWPALAASWAREIVSIDASLRRRAR